MIDKATAERIKSAADIVEVVSDYVHLTRRGANYMGLCPFHNERTPSFSVNKNRNFCYCFSCHKGGSPVNFIMEKEGVSYHDALLHLADKYGIKVEERELSDEERNAITEREGMYVANEWAMKRMQTNLMTTEEGKTVGLQYFYSREVTDEAIREFRLGYCLDTGHDLVDAAHHAALDMDVLKRVGLIGTSGSGRNYDRFRGRVIFPILNSSGKPIAFGGRDLKGGPAKYINSPESAIYVKSNELYGIFQAKSEIVKQDRCYLVEGYMDVIGMWQSGLRNVIASSGTALTDGQIALIHRFTNNVTLIYDGDAAGIKAALRGINMLLSHKLNVKVLLLPDGMDPDDFAKKHSPEVFREYVDKHQTDIIRFKIDVLLKDAGSDPQRKTQAIMSVVESIAHIPLDVERIVYIRECASLFGVDEESIGVAVSRARSQVVERLSQDRRRREQQQQLPQDVTLSQSIANNAPSPASNVLPDSLRRVVDTNRNPLKPLERNIIEYCIRFGFIDFCESSENPGTTVNVAQYVAEELQADNIQFTVPEYQRIFNLFAEMLPDYNTALADMKLRLEESQSHQRKIFQEDIVATGLSIPEIERKEKEFEKLLTSQMQTATHEFAKNYAPRILASHEDSRVRAVVNEIISGRHTASKIYARQQPDKPASEDNYEFLVPRSIVELKNEILSNRISDIRKSLSALSAETDKASIAKSEEIMRKLLVLQKMRMELARNIGERIISPKR